MEVGQHGGLADPRVDDDQCLVAVGLETLPENRVVVGDVGADEQDDIGLFEILVRSRRPVRSERAFVAGHRRGHAERGVAVVVPCAETELHQLTEGVELLRDELPGTDDANRLAAIRRLYSPELAGHRLQRDIPADTLAAALRV